MLVYMCACMRARARVCVCVCVCVLVVYVHERACCCCVLCVGVVEDGWVGLPSQYWSFFVAVWVG